MQLISYLKACKSDNIPETEKEVEAIYLLCCFRVSKNFEGTFWAYQSDDIVPGPLHKSIVAT